MPGSVTHLFIKPGHRIPMQSVQEFDLVNGQGIVGDASYGRAKRQVLVVESEVLRQLSIEPGMLRENINVEGFELTGISPDEKLVVGDVVLEVTGDCNPCNRLDEIRPGLKDELANIRGILARVDGDGKIRVGDSIRRLQDAN